MSDSLHTADDFLAKSLSSFQKADISIFHQFSPPPSGGGHQFLRAFIKNCESRGLVVENNTISHTTRSCLFNSFNFLEKRLSRLHRDSVLYVHRLDGPIDVYRGYDQGVDRRIWEISKKFANKTIFQSQYSLKKHLEFGMNFNSPSIILNAVDPDIFYSHGRIEFSPNRKTKIVAVSWSSNPNKGSTFYNWLDNNLDWDKFEFTFIGRSPIQFKHIRIIDPVTSDVLANLLRQNDIYITASQNDPCSNSLLEALSCGCPAIYLISGGHPEIVNNAGLGFNSAEEIPELLNKVTNDFDRFQKNIDIPSIQEVTNKYLQVLELI